MRLLVAAVCFLSAVYAPAPPPCGVPVVQPNAPTRKRIVGGQVAVQGSWPWKVMIVDNFGLIAGTGAIINPYVVITSAQQFGGWNDHTRPVCLADSSHMYSMGQHCYLAGWGSTSSTGNEEVLHQLMYPILQDRICSNHCVDFLSRTEVFAGYENSTKDFCVDDIGSPLVCKASNGAWYINGLASSGGDCHKGDEPGIFEDVHTYNDWIIRTMEQANYPYQY